jgi:hypothetical protein
MKSILLLLACWLLCLSGLCAAEPDQHHLLLCGMAEVFEINPAELRFDGTPSQPRKLWSWRAQGRPDIPAELQQRFGTTDDCKPVRQGEQVLITSSGGGCALVARPTGTVLWAAAVPNAHSIELLPGERILVAGSTAPQGNRLVLFDIRKGSQPIWETELYSGHGVVWDADRQRVWALGFDQLQCYELSAWETEQPALRLQQSFPLPDPGGHDLQPLPGGADLLVSTHEHVFLFDRDQGAFRKHPQLGDQQHVKCVSPAPTPTGEPVAWIQGTDDHWWNDVVQFVTPSSGTSQSASLTGEKLYKARWVAARPALSCEQRSPETMAAELGLTLPRRPWHLANIWWQFEQPVEQFERLEIEVEIDREIPADYNLYISPCGIAKINGLQFYGGLQTNINGWASRESRERVHRGHGGIFSRWSSDKTTPIGLEHVRTAAEECLVESAGYEGEFASVRRPFRWTAGKSIYRILKTMTEEDEQGRPATWFACQITTPDGETIEVGSLRFEGEQFTFWDRHSAFVEVYSTAPLPRSGIPIVNVRFGHPRLNGEPVKLRSASAYYPDQSTQASPDCAWVRAVEEGYLVEVGPIFRRDPSLRRHPLPLP